MTTHFCISNPCATCGRSTSGPVGPTPYSVDVRPVFAEEVDDMPWECMDPDHGSDAHKHAHNLRRWFYKPARPTTEGNTP